MIIDRDIAIPTDDGHILRADVFRPDAETPAPVIMVQGPYGKGVEYKDGYGPQWNWLIEQHPNLLPGSERKYETWETVDPEIWTTWGYIVIRVDMRGSGRTAGLLDTYQPREIKDFYDAIEWAGSQEWSNGKVGLLGISCYAISQWLVAALQPPHLTAMTPWEGSGDYYRELARHGGIASNAFLDSWFKKQVVSNQHGNPNGYKDPWLNERATGPTVLSEEELLANRIDPVQNTIDHPLFDQWSKDRSADFSRVKVPFLSAGNWGAIGLHGRGNFEGFVHAASTEKWLEVHTGRHDEGFYLDDAMDLQRRFLDHYLQGQNNGWERTPRVSTRMRHPGNVKGELRYADEWPLPNTKWTKLFLSASDQSLSWTSPESNSNATFEAMGEELRFTSQALDRETEFTGPLALKSFVSSTTQDADLFVTIQAFSPEGKEVEFQGGWDPHTPLSQGWLRASHRKIDEARTKPYRPYHSHDEIQPLNIGEIYELDIEIWVTSIILPPGYTLSVLVGGKDFARIDDGVEKLDWNQKGSGPFLHNHPADRGSDTYKGKTTLYTGPDAESYLLLPLIE